MNGWLKLHRALVDKPIWLDATPEQKGILITLLTMANYEEKEWEWGGETYSLQPGQFVTSLPSLINKCGRGMTESKIRTGVEKICCARVFDGQIDEQKSGHNHCQLGHLSRKRCACIRQKHGQTSDKRRTKHS